MAVAQQAERDDPVADVRAAITQIQGGGSAPPAPEPLPDAEASQLADSEAALDAAAERARDDKGRFKAAEEAPEPKEIKATTDARPAPVAAPQPAAIKPPPGWSPDAKAEFAKLSPAVQQAVIKRETEVSDGFRQKSDELRRLTEIDGIVAPRRQQYQRFGFKSDAEAINHLFTLSDSMERDPAGTLAHLARHYGIDPARLAGGQPTQQQNAQPQQRPQDINTLVEEQIGLRFARMEIDDFLKDPVNAHAEELKPMMGMFLGNGQAPDLKTAYDMALRAHPTYGTEWVNSQIQQARQQDTAKVLEDVSKKRRASGASLTGAPHGAPQRAPRPASSNAFDDVAEDVRAAVAQLS